jgi:hypothetical protein
MTTSDLMNIIVLKILIKFYFIYNPYSNELLNYNPVWENPTFIICFMLEVGKKCLPQFEYCKKR